MIIYIDCRFHLFLGWLAIVVFVSLLLGRVKDMEMETADVDLVSTEWNDLPYDLRMMILSWLPVECSYMFRIVAKEWKDLLSSIFHRQVVRGAYQQQQSSTACSV